MRTLAVTVVRPSTADSGNMASIVVRGARVWAAGGSSYQPTCLYSHDGGRSFVRWSAPASWGLRGAFEENDVVWVTAGGGVARTSAGDGDVWELVDVGAEPSMFYTITRCAHGLLTAVGDGGTVVHSRTGRRWRTVKTRSTGRIFDLYAEPGTNWLVDSDGMLQRSTKAGYVEVPFGKAMRVPRPLCGVTRTPARTLLVIGDGGMVLRSTTDAASWKKIPIDSRADLERVLVTRFGIFVIGDHGSLLVSYDDGRSFQGFTTALADHLWSIAEIDGDLLVGGDAGQIWRIAKRELAAAMRDAFAERDRVVSDLAARVHDGDDGADLVLEDALRERELW